MKVVRTIPDAKAGSIFILLIVIGIIMPTKQAKPKFIKIAKDISTNIHKLDIASTHEPPSVAAGCILMVAVIYRLDITKKQISDVFKIALILVVVG